MIQTHVERQSARCPHALDGDGESVTDAAVVVRDLCLRSCARFPDTLGVDHDAKFSSEVFCAFVKRMGSCLIGVSACNKTPRWSGPRWSGPTESSATRCAPTPTDARTTGTVFSRSPSSPSRGHAGPGGPGARHRPGTGVRSRGGAATQPPPGARSHALAGALAGPHVRRRRVAARGGDSEELVDCQDRVAECDAAAPRRRAGHRDAVTLPPAALPPPPAAAQLPPAAPAAPPLVVAPAGCREAGLCLTVLTR